MAPAQISHQPPAEDSGRWLGFRFRPGDIVISTRPKSGTTWMQMICALLIFQTPDLPYPLWQLSPWLENPAAPREHTYAQLAAQQHRRFIKTHTPFAEIPVDPQVTYIVTVRNPLDAFVSLYHQDQLLDLPPAPPPPPPPGRPRRPGRRQPPGPPGFPPPPREHPHPHPHPHPPPGGAWPPPGKPPPPPSREILHDALVEWIGDDGNPPVYPESLRRAMAHVSAAWARRGEPNVVLVHYDDLLSDLEGQMRRLAARLGIAVPEQSWPVLAEAATFERMRDREDILVPPPPGVLPDASAFFRRGTSGAGREILSDEELAGYYTQVARLGPADMIEWLHRPVMGR